MAVAIILLILVPMILLWRTGYFQRQYGFAGFPERIAVFLYDGERVLKPDEYALSARFSDEDLPVSPIADGYAVDGGEYGVYRFTLVCGGTHRILPAMEHQRLVANLRDPAFGPGRQRPGAGELRHEQQPALHRNLLRPVDTSGGMTYPSLPHSLIPSKSNPPYDRRHTEDCCLRHVPYAWSACEGCTFPSITSCRVMPRR
ncbi:MAG: hypothetical protein SOY30_01425 [Eubacteriales bacterium]|nr:hypothetical protein [Eubacteriales bacterium]